MKRWIGLWVVLCLRAAWSQTVRSHCDQAERPDEQAVCSSAPLGVAAKQMAAAYRMAHLPLSVGAAKALRVDQKQWLVWIATVCHSSQPQPAAKLAGCMVGPYRERAEDLTAAVRTCSGVVFFTRSVYRAHEESDQEDTAGVEFAGVGTLRARWLEADTDDPGWSAWNVAVRRAALKAAGERSSWTDDAAAGQDADVRMTLTLLTSRMVSVEVEIDGMGHGAAHPYDQLTRVHWLRQQGRELRTDDVFASGPLGGSTLPDEASRPLSGTSMARSRL